MCDCVDRIRVLGFTVLYFRYLILCFFFDSMVVGQDVEVSF